MPAPIVPIAQVKSADVTIFETFTGTTEARRQVDVRAQIGGILQSRNYIEGEQVEKGTPLFTIDNRPYMALLKEAQATQAAAQATQNSAQRDWARINTLFGKGEPALKIVMMPNRRVKWRKRQSKSPKPKLLPHKSA